MIDEIKFCTMVVVSLLISTVLLFGCGKKEEAAPVKEEKTEEVAQEEELVDRRTDIQKYWNGDWYGYDDGDTYNEPTGVIEIHVDDTIGKGSHGTLISTGGWMFVKDKEVEEGEIYTKPDEEYSIDCVYIRYEYKDGTMPAFFKWYTPLIEAGWALPDDFDSYYNDSTDFENELGSSRITHGFDKDIQEE